MASSWDAGPLFSDLEDAHGVRRVRALGPIFEWARAPDGATLFAVRPLFCYARDGSGHAQRREILWPLVSQRTRDRCRTTRVLWALETNFDTSDPAGRRRLWILPFFFRGRDRDGQKYMAVFPLGGRIHEFLWQDRIRFVLFPLYLESSVGKSQTRTVLWPIFSRTRGGAISRVRVFPFYGRVRHRARYEKGFVLWPFFTWAHYNYPDATGRAYIVFPLWGHFKMPDQETWLILPPFFRFSRGERMNYSYAPWPFVQISQGQIERRYLWPLWGRRRSPGVRSGFFLWPIFRTTRTDRGDVVRRSFRAFPIIYSDVDFPRSPEGVSREPVARRHRVWPLISYQQEGDDRRLRLLDLWPFWNDSPVERNWAPAWTLAQWSLHGANADAEILWGLVRSTRRGSHQRAFSIFPIWTYVRDDRQTAVREWSVLKGLVARRREGDLTRWRLLYVIPLGNRRGSPSFAESQNITSRP